MRLIRVEQRKKENFTREKNRKRSHIIFRKKNK
jgi:hypothetical protein